MVRPTMPCRCCHGTGREALTKPYATTFGAVPIQWLDTPAILRRHPLGQQPMPTALVNRLNKLVRWGLVERIGSGRQVLWRKR